MGDFNMISRSASLFSAVVVLSCVCVREEATLYIAESNPSFQDVHPDYKGPQTCQACIAPVHVLITGRMLDTKPGRSLSGGINLPAIYSVN